MYRLPAVHGFVFRYILPDLLFFRDPSPESLIIEPELSDQQRQIPQDRFCGDCKYNKQHDAFHRHSRDGEQVVQINAAEQKSQDTSAQDGGAELVHRRADLVEDHESDDGQQHGRCRRDVRRIYAECSSEDHQGAHGKCIRDGRRKGFQEYVRQEMSPDQVLIRLHGQEEGRDADGEHTDQ